MEQHTLILFLLFFSFFLFVTSMLQTFSKRFPIPYTVALLFAGLLTQLAAHNLHLEVTYFTLSSDIIYYILLPLLLFESAMHIHIHQFSMQFKTISFLATFGLLLSVFVIGFIMAIVLQLPFQIALLFGALISATDPIAVIALFKSLGAPKRLGLIADGESMFNDATGVIAYRIIAGFVLANTAFESETLFQGLGNFFYMFIGSMIFGVIIGYIASIIVARIQEDRVVENTLLLALAIFSFVAAEHFFHLSGVISTVMAGITLGNLGKTKISAGVKDFVHEWWEYVAFLGVSLVFFFAAFNLDLALFLEKPMALLIAIGSVLVGRAVSVYVSFLITNHTPFFKNEPNVPMSWQHIMNWGGLRGVIPLVLVYSLPEDFVYRQEILGYTLATLLFTLIINGLTIQWLLIKLGLHVPQNEEKINEEEKKLFTLEVTKSNLAHLPPKQFSARILHKIEKELDQREQQFKQHLYELVKSADFLKSLKLQALEVERVALNQLYSQGRFNESVFYSFESDLDLQQDELDFPELYTGKGVRGAERTAQLSFRKRLFKYKKFISNFPWLSILFGISEEKLILERYGLMRARIFTSQAVLQYFDVVEKIFQEKSLKNAISEVRAIQDQYIKENTEEMLDIEKKYPELTSVYQENIIRSLIRPAAAAAHP